jgi:hypothetical protein
LSDPHVRRLLRFACLAPDIVAAIVEGRQPRTLTVKRLLQGIPLAWSDQRAAFGFGCRAQTHAAWRVSSKFPGRTWLMMTR